ncbi:hypothetical protein VHEMI00063 [[Torrubiella] hemipterigena]|uniref:NADP-dependent oxidoreductase domain-containing protein n=1 Tax=[Torrubiella] hemipterigena TaxID=1531966 RepID=A0A0A1SI81_9HYPO|nr:hypothetical protein VHEMI00063 [[Torrubiella] hemipterigena]
MKDLAILRERKTLANGKDMPAMQLGLYTMTRPEVARIVPLALQKGYRGFDSAQMYDNEGVAGRAIIKFLSSPKNTAELTREDIFYTTKLTENSENYHQVRDSISRSLARCNLGYIDLVLLHSPYGGKKARLVSWRAVEDAILAGQVRMGGVSNFGAHHIEELMASNPRVKPVVNQIEVHPFNTQAHIRQVSLKYELKVQAYASMVRGMRMRHPKIVELANKNHCTPAQLLLKWGVAQDMIVLPKTIHPERLEENADISGVHISDLDMDELNALDEMLVTDWDPTTCD